MFYGLANMLSSANGERDYLWTWGWRWRCAPPWALQIGLCMGAADWAVHRHGGCSLGCAGGLQIGLCLGMGAGEWAVQRHGGGGVGSASALECLMGMGMGARESALRRSRHECVFCTSAPE